MVKDYHLQINYLDKVDSTQKYLKKLLLDKKVYSPYAVVSDIQTDGVGSRDNNWIGQRGNLFLSFSFYLKDMPKDLKLESASIYFSYILKYTLSEFGSKVWMKWPNDFYVQDSKIGGVITNVVQDSIVCGIGLNLVKSPKEFDILDIKISREKLLEKYFENLEKKISWKQVFSKYKLEFHLNQKYFTNIKDKKVSLKDAILEEDGTIVINNERIYSLR
jgi:BirA family biotin operon repressor/biotin-[acetyl-CoA-carboxylase] ligase